MRIEEYTKYGHVNNGKFSYTGALEAMCNDNRTIELGDKEYHFHRPIKHSKDSIYWSIVGDRPEGTWQHYDEDGWQFSSTVIDAPNGFIDYSVDTRPLRNGPYEIRNLAIRSNKTAIRFGTYKDQTANGSHFRGLTIRDCSMHGSQPTLDEWIYGVEWTAGIEIHKVKNVLIDGVSSRGFCSGITLSHCDCPTIRTYRSGVVVYGLIIKNVSARPAVAGHFSDIQVELFYQCGIYAETGHFTGVRTENGYGNSQWSRKVDSVPKHMIGTIGYVDGKYIRVTKDTGKCDLIRGYAIHAGSKRASFSQLSLGRNTKDIRKYPIAYVEDTGKSTSWLGVSGAFGKGIYAIGNPKIHYIGDNHLAPTTPTNTLYL